MKKQKQENRYKDSINLPQTAFPMKAGLPQREPKVLAQWQQMDVYQRLQDERVDAPLFVLHDGPPYANGDIHIGHAMQKILKDIVVKSRNLMGYRTPFVPGWDCHGLPIEIQVEKKHGKAGVKIDRSEFRKKCREYAHLQIEKQKKDFIRLGLLGEWHKPYLTMDYKTEADTVRSLAKIVDSGHLYHGLMPVLWCPACASALAEAEVEYQDKSSPAIDVKFHFADTSMLASNDALDLKLLDDAAIVIWTTTPWTLPANEAVSIHPELDYVLIEANAERLVIAAELVDSAMTRYGIESYEEIARFSGSDLEGALVAHPFYDKRVPVILGEHVTTEAGTGAVHTAPAHGGDDFEVGKRYALPVVNPVSANGTFLPNTELFAGEFVFKANANIIEVLQQRDNLLQHVQYEHSYPHCWRHKTPIIYRATAQWFIGMDRAQESLRDQAMTAIKAVNWEPSWGQKRIEGMIEGRPDWCISRQRNWGVPIPIYLHRETGELHPDTVSIMEGVAERIEQQGIQAWYDLDDGDFLGDAIEDYEKVRDTLDVWFDSGVTHDSVLRQRQQLRFPADLYLEGSDQHRGWFQSSLLTSVAINQGKAPYKCVLTHGFTVDKNGRKMSKSLGNVIAPQQVLNQLGADILRLWVASTDYTSEMSLSDEILKRAADSYRRLRNTSRYLLGNLADFEQSDQIPYDDMLSLDQWAVRRARELQLAVEQAFEEYQFHTAYHRLHRFCTVQMGGFYLDIIKDRLYTMPSTSKARRSAQTAMYHILQSLVRLFAPIISFTAEEIWSHMKWAGEDSVLLATRYTELDAIAADEDDKGDRFWSDLVSIGDEVRRQIEAMRTKGGIGAALDVGIRLYLDKERYARYLSIAETDELRFVFIASSTAIHAIADAPANAIETGDDGLKFTVDMVDDIKCVRCWHRRQDVGQDQQHPELCGRCVSNVEGDGEVRRYA